MTRRRKRCCICNNPLDRNVRYTKICCVCLGRIYEAVICQYLSPVQDNQHMVTGFHCGYSGITDHYRTPTDSIELLENCLKCAYRDSLSVDFTTNTFLKYLEQLSLQHPIQARLWRYIRKIVVVSV